MCYFYIIVCTIYYFLYNLLYYGKIFLFAIKGSYNFIICLIFYYCYICLNAPKFIYLCCCFYWFKFYIYYLLYYITYLLRLYGFCISFIIIFVYWYYCFSFIFLYMRVTMKILITIICYYIF